MRRPSSSKRPEQPPSPTTMSAASYTTSRDLTAGRDVSSWSVCGRRACRISCDPRADAGNNPCSRQGDQVVAPGSTGRRLLVEETMAPPPGADIEQPGCLAAGVGGRRPLIGDAGSGPTVGACPGIRRRLLAAGQGRYAVRVRDASGRRRQRWPLPPRPPRALGGGDRWVRARATEVGGVSAAPRAPVVQRQVRDRPLRPRTRLSGTSPIEWTPGRSGHPPLPPRSRSGGRRSRGPGRL
jgi:hypothetical protein